MDTLATYYCYLSTTDQQQDIFYHLLLRVVPLRRHHKSPGLPGYIFSRLFPQGCHKTMTNLEKQQLTFEVSLQKRQSGQWEKADLCGLRARGQEPAILT